MTLLRTFGRRIIRAIMCCGISLTALQPALSQSIRGLPSDEWMLEHFRVKRPAFEEVVRLYQRNELHVERKEGGKVYLDPSTRFKEIQRDARVSNVGSDGAVWLPDPYATKSGIAARKMNVFLPSPYSGVIIKLEHRLTYSWAAEIGRTVWKNYYYVPVLPRIEDDWLHWPVDESGEVFRKSKVVSNLDEFPLKWFRSPLPEHRGLRGCVFRRIEAQWFVGLCNG